MNNYYCFQCKTNIAELVERSKYDDTEAQFIVKDGSILEFAVCSSCASDEDLFELNMYQPIDDYLAFYAMVKL